MASSEFFNVQPVDEALQQLLTHVQSALPSESLDPRHALGRVLADAVTSPLDLPEFRRSTMDGYAVRAADTFGASQALPAMLSVVGHVAMGTKAEIRLEPGQTAEIHTGGMLPGTADAVVMVEKTQHFGTNQIEVLAPVAPGENMIDIGEDQQQGAVILPKGHRLRPQDIGGLLASGILSVDVVVRPRVGILSCGDEIVPPEQVPQPGQIRDINAYTLAALVKQAGAQPDILGIAKDTLDAYLTLAKAGLDSSDVLILTAGSSVSTRDLTRQVISSLGAPGVLQHGLAVKPGKPTVLAVCDGKPVIGLPGNPVSALLVARQLLVPLIRSMLGESLRRRSSISATLVANVPSATGRLDTVPVRLIEDAEDLMADPVFGKSNLIFTLIAADGVIEVPLDSNGLRAGTMVDVLPFDTA